MKVEGYLCSFLDSLSLIWGSSWEKEGWRSQGCRDAAPCCLKLLQTPPLQERSSEAAEGQKPLHNTNDVSLPGSNKPNTAQLFGVVVLKWNGQNPQKSQTVSTCTIPLMRGLWGQAVKWRLRKQTLIMRSGVRSWWLVSNLYLNWVHFVQRHLLQLTARLKNVWGFNRPRDFNNVL